MTERSLHRSQLLWLMLGHWMVVLPHIQQVPGWIIVLSGLTGLWRLAADRGVARIPPWPLRLVLAIAAVLGVVLTYRTLIGLEPMVGLLVVAAALKLLELRQQRDAQVIVCLGVFIVATHLIYHQSLPMAFFALGMLMVLLLTLVRLTLGNRASLTRTHCWLVGRMMLWAAPLMVTLFLIFPRIEPLWAVPVVGGGAVTGMDDRLSPGSVSQLARSDAVAFRVRFEGQPPAKSEWYWRGMVLDQFDQGVWTRTHWRDIPATERRIEPVTDGGAPLRYQVLQPASHQRWLFTLPRAQTGDSRVAETPTQHLISRQPIEVTSRFDITTYPEAVRQPVLSSWWRDHAVTLPEDVNPRSRAYVQELRQRFPDDRALVQAVLDTFRREAFYYTLSPTPIQGDNFVDQFLFDQRRGFCEHYAYAFVVLMRQAGIPARIIGGYQGGELNPDTGTVVVRQLDAHAWAEVWLEGEGWQRVDPTAAVAPGRIDFGAAEAIQGEPLWLAGSGLSAYRLRHIPLVDWLRWQYDDLAWQWQQTVVGYDQRRQLNAMTQWLAWLPGLSVGALLMAVWATILVALFVLGNPRPKQSPSRAAERAYIRLCQKLKKRGIDRRFGESAPILLDRAVAVLGEADPLVVRLSALADALYAPPPPSGGQ